MFLVIASVTLLIANTFSRVVLLLSSRPGMRVLMTPLVVHLMVGFHDSQTKDMALRLITEFTLSKLIIQFNNKFEM